MSWLLVFILMMLSSISVDLLITSFSMNAVKYIFWCYELADLLDVFNKTLGILCGHKSIVVQCIKIGEDITLKGMGDPTEPTLACRFTT